MTTMTSAGGDADLPPHDEAEALSRLRAQGGRLTRSRRELVEHFYRHDDGITVDELMVRYPAFDQATLYRAVHALEEAGIVEHTHLGHGPATYKRAGAPTISVVCQRCGYAIEVPRSELETLAARLRATDGFVVDLHHFAITGTCAACAAAGRRAAPS